MAPQWECDDTFHLGINMAGAVSAGAYTAGVLDFLVEALEQWYKAKDDPASAVPRHNVCIEVFSGASAGGMCAAIASAMVQGSFDHIHNPQDMYNPLGIPDLKSNTFKETTNRFYESWVNKIDIQWLLQDNDLDAGGKVVSLLDSSIIDQIADYAIAPGAEEALPYISKSLTLFLTLTNVRGVPYSLNGDAPGSAEEDIGYYADWLQFETVSKPESKPSFPLAKPLPLGSSQDAWPLLKQAAKATGAFPLFLAPRKIDRDPTDFNFSPWEPISDPRPNKVKPDWNLKPGDKFTTLNVDGGVTDNDPFQLAHDFLAVHNPLRERDLDTGELLNPREQNRANCAVLTVAPFPAYAMYDANYNFDQNSGVFGMLPNLFTALISQSRFQGESLSSVIDTASYSRFVMAPSDDARKGEDALQCAVLSAFGGFFERGFRAHDYQLGRRNCQKFLRDTFRLTLDNPIMDGTKELAPADLDALIDKFKPTDGNPGRTLPIIPLCGSVVEEVAAPERAKITPDRVAHILNWIVDRLHAVAKPLLEEAIGKDHQFENWAARSAVDTLISTWGKSRISDVLNKALEKDMAG